MRIKDFLAKLYYKSSITFYINDKIIDFYEIEDCEYELDGFEIDGQVLRLYSNEYKTNKS